MSGCDHCSCPQKGRPCCYCGEPGPWQATRVDVIPSGTYVLELVSELVPRDYEDDWLWREEAADA